MISEPIISSTTILTNNNNNNEVTSNDENINSGNQIITKTGKRIPQRKNNKKQPRKKRKLDNKRKYYEGDDDEDEGEEENNEMEEEEEEEDFDFKPAPSVVVVKPPPKRRRRGEKLENEWELNDYEDEIIRNQMNESFADDLTNFVGKKRNFYEFWNREKIPIQFNYHLNDEEKKLLKIEIEKKLNDERKIENEKKEIERKEINDKQKIELFSILQNVIQFYDDNQPNPPDLPYCSYHQLPLEQEDFKFVKQIIDSNCSFYSFYIYYHL